MELMKFKVEKIISEYAFKYSVLTEEQAIRDIGFEIIKNMPLSYLKELLNLEKIDPYDKNVLDKIRNQEQAEEIEKLRHDSNILFKATVLVGDKK